MVVRETVLAVYFLRPENKSRSTIRVTKLVAAIANVDKFGGDAQILEIQLLVEKIQFQILQERWEEALRQPQDHVVLVYEEDRSRTLTEVACLLRLILAIGNTNYDGVKLFLDDSFSTIGSFSPGTFFLFVMNRLGSRLALIMLDVVKFLIGSRSLELIGPFLWRVLLFLHFHLIYLKIIINNICGYIFI